jgi:hypothetical protein
MKYTLFAIDPGPEKSAFVQWNGSVIDYGHVPNEEMRQLLIGREYDECAIEMISSYGMAVGASVFNTCLWVGKILRDSEEGTDVVLPQGYQDVPMQNAKVKGQGHPAGVAQARWRTRNQNKPRPDLRTRLAHLGGFSGCGLRAKED